MRPDGAQGALFGNLTNMSLARQYPTVPVASSITAYRPQVARPATSDPGSLAAATVMTPRGSLRRSVRFHRWSCSRV